jgi:hypothetical protein
MFIIESVGPGIGPMSVIDRPPAKPTRRAVGLFNPIVKAHWPRLAYKPALPQAGGREIIEVGHASNLLE